MIRKVNLNEVLDEFLACPYCLSQLNETYQACCGEAGHAEIALELTNDEVILKSEIELD